MPQKTKHTPMMQQYFSIKEKYPDCLLFYRLGDFYELFYDDAIEAARLLEITLTSRNKNAEDPIPMCGVPHHAAKEYIKTLIELGKKVAICEQLEDPKLTKGMVKRDVVQVLTPGTYTEYQAQNQNHYLVSILPLVGKRFALSYVDVSTGELKVTQLENLEEVRSECSSLMCREVVLVESDVTEELRHLFTSMQILISTIEKDEINAEDCTDLVSELEDEASIRCVQNLLSYLKLTQKRSFSHLQKAQAYQSEFYLSMNYETKRNLELTTTIRANQKHGSLFWFLDETQTAMGGRLLKQWLEKPLVLEGAIQRRHALVETLNQHYFERTDFIETLKRVYDLERIVGKVSFGTANARDLLQLKQTLGQVPIFKSIVDSLDSEEWSALGENLFDIPELYDLIDRAIDEDAPLTISDGNIIRSGYNATLDTYRDTMKHGKEWIAALQQQEREQTGISSLKISFNKVFGYYIEVTKSNLSKLDSSRYERKQTLANAERFITPELKEKETLILEAEEKSSALEYQLFVEVREQVKHYTAQLQQLAKTVATIDVLQAFSVVSERYHLVKPTISMKNRRLWIEDGRHPVVEKVMGQSTYVPNSISMSPEEHILLITGPNMSGKSTYMRQLALCVILAQIGCFVPAKSATIPVFTKIFTRIGAADDLISGQSTFMVEMMETNHALRNADETSLLLFDEIGRGTATYDGMALAEAIITYIHEHLTAKVLFSTHYHELTRLSEKYADLRNVHVGVVEENGEVVFLHKVLEGPADKSYGIHVAKLAGLPRELLENASTILNHLEAKGAASDNSTFVEQVSLFEEERESMPEWVHELKGLNLMSMTPMDAMNILYKWQQMEKGE